MPTEKNGTGDKVPQENTAPQRQVDREAAPCPVVGLGASAGGIDALQVFFDNLPPDSGLAYVVVLHLSPDTRSHLAELLSRHTSLPVEQVTGEVEVAPDHVYVTAPGSLLALKGGRLTTYAARLDQRSQTIDAFLFSLAEQQESDAACILLSGTGSDGTMGMRAVKEHCGLCLAQTPATAAHGGMLESAISTGLIDRVLDIEDMPRALADYFERQRENQRQADNNGVRPDVLDGLPDIFDVLREATNQDFSRYKRPTLARRVQRRMQATTTDTLADYLRRLKEDPDEPTRLLKDLLIGVTEFFRDPEAFAALREQVLPRLFDGRGADDPLRVWVAGCATGEEAYSMAILLLEHSRGLDHPPDFTVFASDIDARALNIGRRGHYSAASLRNLPEELVARYFTPHEDFYVIRDAVREHILFANHNVLRDPPFSRLDLISCRNLMIYLESDIQERLLQTFHYALRDNGYLMLGTSENTRRGDGDFQPVDRGHRIFRRQEGNPRVAPDFPLVAMTGARLRTPRSRPAGLEAGGWGAAVERIVLSRFAPAWVVVDESLNVRKFSSRTGKYLEAAPGEPSSSILRLARADIQDAVRNAIGRAFREKQRISRPGLCVRIDGAEQYFELVAEPLPAQDPDEGSLCLVVFSETEPMIPAGGRVSRHEEEARQRRDADAAASQDDRDAELYEVRERLMAATEQLETSMEEQKATNEELSSMNEELQSTNEELETSREELQSSNEELQTVNSELAHRVEDLARANNDLNNLFVNTHVATLFVDRDLCVRNFTPPTTDIFHLVETDKGRPLAHIAHKLDGDQVFDDTKRVIRDLQRVERECTMKDGTRSYVMRIEPYRTLDNRIDGAVISFSDVTHLKESEGRLRESEAHQRRLLRELQHRVNNMLATVRGIARQTYEHSSDLENYYEAFDGRLSTFARVQAMIGTSATSRAGVKDIILEELLAYAATPGETLRVEGPDLAVQGRSAQSFALFIHELATNAVKYGALAHDHGRIDVTWHVERREDAPWMIFEWRESGVPIEGEPGPGGFGQRLIDAGIPHELGGTSRREVTEDGFCCIMDIPFGEVLDIEAEVTDEVGGEDEGIRNDL